MLDGLVGEYGGLISLAKMLVERAGRATTERLVLGTTFLWTDRRIVKVPTACICQRIILILRNEPSLWHDSLEIKR